MSDGSLFDLFIQEASNGATLNEANKWLPRVERFYRKRDIIDSIFIPMWRGTRREYL